MSTKKLKKAKKILQFGYDEEGKPTIEEGRGGIKELFRMFGISVDTDLAVSTEILQEQLPYLIGDVDTDQEMSQKLNMILSQLQAMEPSDPVETMLTMQMIGIHDASLKVLNQINKDEVSVDAFERYIGYTQKLSSTSARLASALSKYKNKGNQKMTVKHVHVHEGGQAAIGNFNGKGEGE